MALFQCVYNYSMSRSPKQGAKRRMVRATALEPKCSQTKVWLFQTSGCSASVRHRRQTERHCSRSTGARQASTSNSSSSGSAVRSIWGQREVKSHSPSLAFSKTSCVLPGVYTLPITYQPNWFSSVSVRPWNLPATYTLYCMENLSLGKSVEIKKI